MTEKTIEFITKCKKIHEDKYDYSETEYKNIRTKIIVTCRSHGQFKVSPDNHFRHKSGCPKCSLEKHKLTKISPKRLEKLKSIHNNRYSYESLEVNNGFISILCPIHGEFSQRIYAHERGHGCGRCYIESRKKETIEKTKLCKSCNMISSNFSPKFKICKNCQESPIIPSHKICTICNTKKTTKEYPKRKSQWDGYRNECMECFSKIRTPYRKIYREKNKDSIREKNKIYHKNRMKSDLIYRVKIISRNVIRKALSKGGYTKRSRTYEILGCSYEEFKIHLESLFLENMNWDNRHLWDIDHIVPISLAESENEMIILNYHTNLRPLWKTVNEYKSDKITEEVKSSPIYKELIENRNLSFPSVYFGSFNVTIN
jgi:hypothetical protein